MALFLATADCCRSLRCLKYCFANSMTSASGTLNIAYGPHPLQKMDVLFPQNFTVETPVVFLIHGGGFVMGRKEDFSVPARMFCEENFVVVNLSHRLVDADWFSKMRVAAKDAVQINDQLGDVASAVQLYKSRATEWGTGKEKIYMAGHSAGAILSLLYMLSDDGSHTIRAAGNWAGITDLSLPTDTLGPMLTPWQSTHIQNMYNRMIDYSGLAGNSGDIKAISPYWIARKRGSRPVISLYPEHNVVLQFPGESALGLMQTKRFHALLRELGVTEQFSLYKGCDHSFRGPADAWQRAVRETADFFREH